jgi:DNA-binding beta-propeller fold protein YncE
VAINPVTNKIYVVNQGGTNVTVIDGATNYDDSPDRNDRAVPVAVVVNR